MNPIKRQVFSYYKTPLLLALTLFVTLLGVTVERDPVNIAILLIGALLGVFLLDFDYLIYTIFEPTDDFSVNLTSYINHGDYAGALHHINLNKSRVLETTLNSGLFQIVLIATEAFILNTPNNLLLKVLVLSTLVNSAYRLAENYFSQGGLHNWFWMFNIKLNQNGVIGYFALVGFSILYFIVNF
ncbi:MAG: hypothetical protein R3B92_01575 [Patescibacteria group bacterium]